ncbi:MAG: hypothetical protein AB1798_03360 [Spirochaetota bacterium]
MKKIILILILLISLTRFIYSQDLRPIGNDLSAMLKGLGGEIIPYIQQNVFAGEGTGRAYMGDNSRFFFAFSAGTTFTPGILTFIDAENSNFELLNVYDLMQQALAGVSNTTVTGLLNTTKTLFLFPELRLSLGLRIPADIEIIGMFSIIPQPLTNLITTQIAKIEGIELNQLNVGVRVRKVLLKDEGGFPAISIGTGYSYDNFHAAYAIPAFEQPFANYTLKLNGTISLDTALHSAGLDLIISKKLLIFYPFIKISSWYQWTQYKAQLNPFSAAFYNAGGDVIVDSETQGITPNALLKIQDLSLIFSSGFEIALGKFIILPHGSFNLAARTFNAVLSFRFQF